MMFSPDGNIDPDFACRQMESFPDLIAHLSDEERTALSAAAQRALDFLLAPPDEYGYTRASHVSTEQKSFLESLASGELYKDWCR